MAHGERVAGGGSDRANGCNFEISSTVCRWKLGTVGESGLRNVGTLEGLILKMKDFNAFQF